MDSARSHILAPLGLENRHDATDEATAAAPANKWLEPKWLRRIANGTVEQKEQLSQAVRETFQELRSFGRGPCLIGGAINAEQKELSTVEELGRAGWAEGSEPTCVTANTKRPRRIDQVWVSPEMQARLLNVELSWPTGIKTHAWQQGVFKAGPPDQF